MRGDSSHPFAVNDRKLGATRRRMGREGARIGLLLFGRVAQRVSGALGLDLAASRAEVEVCKSWGWIMTSPE